MVHAIYQDYRITPAMNDLVGTGQGDSAWLPSVSQARDSSLSFLPTSLPSPQHSSSSFKPLRSIASPPPHPPHPREEVWCSYRCLYSLQLMKIFIILLAVLEQEVPICIFPANQSGTSRACHSGLLPTAPTASACGRRIPHLADTASLSPPRFQGTI